MDCNPSGRHPPAASQAGREATLWMPDPAGGCSGPPMPLRSPTRCLVSPCNLVEAKGTRSQQGPPEGPRVEVRESGCMAEQQGQ
jgi:hypothetical protein